MVEWQDQEFGLRAMTSDLDIYRTANALIKQYGSDGAEMHAAMPADELLEAGDADGRRVWLRALAAVEKLSQEGPPERQTVH